MRFRCERDVLVDGLSTAGRAVSSRGGAQPVLAGIRMILQGDRLELTGSDLELTISVELTVAGDTDGEIVIPSLLALDIVKALEPGAVTIDTEGEEARITGGRSQFSLHLIPAEEYPQFGNLPGRSTSF